MHTVPRGWSVTTMLLLGPDWKDDLVRELGSHCHQMTDNTQLLLILCEWDIDLYVPGKPCIRDTNENKAREGRVKSSRHFLVRESGPISELPTQACYLFPDMVAREASVISWPLAAT